MASRQRGLSTEQRRKATLKDTSLARKRPPVPRSRPRPKMPPPGRSNRAPSSPSLQPASLLTDSDESMDLGGLEPTAGPSSAGGDGPSERRPSIRRDRSPPPLVLPSDSESDEDLWGNNDLESEHGENPEPGDREGPIEDPEEESAAADSEDDERRWYLAFDYEPPEPASPSEPGSFDDEGDAVVQPSSSPHSSLDEDIPVHDAPDASLQTTAPRSPLQLQQMVKHPSHIYSQSHAVWYIRLLLVVVLYLHFSFHLPFIACNVLLFAMSLILKHLAPTTARMPLTLITTIKLFDLKDQFRVYPTCPACHHIHVDCNNPEIETCLQCDAELFSTSSSPYYAASILGILPSTQQSRRTPKMVVSFRPISELLSEFLARDGMVEKLDAWRHKQRSEGTLGDVMDGRIWKELEGPDRRPFFGEHCPDELRLGLVIHLDWCNFHRSAQSTHHSTGLFSISVANLPESERYQTKNLLIPCIIPGPKEPNTRQLQEYIVLMVDELLHLYESGMSLPSSPNLLVRVAVTLVICDHPAMCKFFGFADKRHENSPCHRCDVKASKWSTRESLSCGCRTKTIADLRKLAATYQTLSPDKQEQAFKEHGIRWFAFLKLPYFNPLRMAVLDPMHNILLGVVKTQWYEVWIKQERALRETTEGGTKRELHDVHSLLWTAEFPAWLGRIPSQIGIPAGGSLSADEWKTLALVFGPLALPVVWDDWIDAAADEVKKATDKVEATRRRLQKKHDRVMRQWEQSVSASQHTMEEPPPRPETPELPSVPKAESPRLKCGEMKLFLKLSAALTVLLARTVRIQDLELAHQRLLEYLQEYAELYGANAVKPNFHWATHLFEQILDYGPVYGFWAFLQERLNFIVKSFRTNNHGNSELEVTMMRSYSALTSLRNILSSVLATSPNAPVADGVEKQVLKEVVDRLLADPLARGTWGSTAQSTEASHNVNTAYLLGHQRSPERLKPDLATAVLRHINFQPAFLGNPILRASNPNAVSGRTFSNLVTPIDYIILDGRKITAMDAKRGPKKATIIQARWRIADTERICVGELLKIFTASHAEDPLAAVQWLKPTNCHPLREDIWAEYRDVLDIKVWEFQVFTDDANQVPPAVIPLSKIISQAARITVRKAKGSSEKLWLTIGLDKHGTRV